MKTTKYLALPLLLAALTACNSGGTSSSDTSSSTSSSSSITPTGALLVPSAAAAATYTTVMYAPAGATITSVAAVDVQGKPSKAVSVSLNQAAPADCGDGACPEPMTYTVNAAAVVDSNVLNNTLIQAAFSDGSVTNQAITLRLVAAATPEVEASAPPRCYVNAEGTTRLVITLANNTSVVQTVSLSNIKAYAADSDVTSQFTFASTDATSQVITLQPGATASIEAETSLITAEDEDVMFTIQANDEDGVATAVPATTRLAAMSSNASLSYTGDQIYLNPAVAEAKYAYIQNASTSSISAVAAVNNVTGLFVDTALFSPTVVEAYGLVGLDVDETYTADGIQQVVPANCNECAAAYIPTTINAVTLSQLAFAFDSDLQPLTSDNTKELWATAYAEEVTDLAFAITGPNAADFKIEGTVPSALTYLTAAAVKVAYVGAAEAEEEAVLTITGNTRDASNAVAAFTKTIPLTAQPTVAP